MGPNTHSPSPAVAVGDGSDGVSHDAACGRLRRFLAQHGGTKSAQRCQLARSIVGEAMFDDEKRLRALYAQLPPADQADCKDRRRRYVGHIFSLHKLLFVCRFLIFDHFVLFIFLNV